MALLPLTPLELPVLGLAMVGELTALLPLMPLVPVVALPTVGEPMALPLMLFEVPVVGLPMVGEPMALLPLMPLEVPVVGLPTVGELIVPLPLMPLGMPVVAAPMVGELMALLPLMPLELPVVGLWTVGTLMASLLMPFGVPGLEVPSAFRSMPWPSGSFGTTSGAAPCCGMTDVGFSSIPNAPWSNVAPGSGVATPEVGAPAVGGGGQVPLVLAVGSVLVHGTIVWAVAIAVPPSRAAPPTRIAAAAIEDVFIAVSSHAARVRAGGTNGVIRPVVTPCFACMILSTNARFAAPTFGVMLESRTSMLRHAPTERATATPVRRIAAT
jgi:hypothetical protein